MPTEPVREAETMPEDDPTIMALLEAHALLAGMASMSAGIHASPGPRERVQVEIEKATRTHRALRADRDRLAGENRQLRAELGMREARCECEAFDDKEAHDGR